MPYGLLGLLGRFGFLRGLADGAFHSISMSLLNSTAYSIGSTLGEGFMNPVTIMLRAGSRQASSHEIEQLIPR